MSASPRVVLIATAVVASPVVVLLQQGLITLDDALLRGGVVLVACWAALSVVHALAFSPAPPPAPVAEQAASETADPPTPAPEY